VNDPTLWNTVWFRNSQSFELCFQMLEWTGNAPIDLRISDSQPAGGTKATVADMIGMRKRTLTPQRASVVYETSHEFLHPEDAAYLQSISSHIKNPLGYRLSSEDVQQILTRIMPKFSRIRMLIVFCKDYAVAWSVQKALSLSGYQGTSMPLERLELHREWTPGVEHYIAPANSHLEVQPLFGGRHLPSLTHLVVEGAHFDWQNSIIGNLTTFEMRLINAEHSVSLDKFRQILAASPRLERLHLDAAFATGEVSESARPIELRYLRVLLFSNILPEPLLQLCRQFTAPYLRELLLMRFMRYNYESFWTFITGRFSDIRVLALYSIDTTTHIQAFQPLIRFLDSVRKVEFLKISNFAPRSFAALFYTGDSERLHPGLGPLMEQWNAPNNLMASRPSCRPVHVEPPAIDLHPRVILPLLRILEAQNGDWDQLAKMAYFRKLAVHAPLHTLYVGQDMMKVDNVGPMRLMQMRLQYEEVRHLPPGFTTQEEVELKVRAEAELRARGIIL